MARWNIITSDFLGGFAPAWYKETYPTYGNKNHAGDMTNCDLTNPGFMSPGPSLADLTNGTQAGAVTTLINSVLDQAVATNTTYGIGGTKIYQISGSAVTNTGSFPHTITAASGAAVGEDLALYQGSIYYTYNDSTAGEIGKYDLASTFDDDWGSTTPSGAASLEATVPHPIVTGNDVMYIGNGRYIASYDGTTFQAQALDFPTGAVVEDLVYNSDRVWAAVNLPDLSGNNKTTGSIYVWDGTTVSWEAEIRLRGEVGAMHLKNNTIFLWYRDVSSSGGYKLAYISNGAIIDLANYIGSLPTYSQITDYKDFFIWVSEGEVFAYGSGDKDLPVRLFQLADGGHANVGALAAPFGTPMLASWDNATNYRLAQFSGYETNSSWKSLNYDLSGEEGFSRIKTVIINFNALASGASCAWSLVDAQGKTVYTDTISHAKATATSPAHSLTRAVYNFNGLLAENCRIEFDHSGGSTTNPVQIKNYKIYGESSQ